MSSGIYKIANKITEDFYIGSAVDIERRFGEHTTHLKHNNHPNRILQNMFNKYEIKNISFEIVELVPEIEKLIEKEQYYLDKLKPKYNIRKIANSNLGITHSEKTKEQISKSKSKPFKIISPTGELIEGIGLNKFCRENNLHLWNTWRVVTGKRKSSQGWKCAI